MPISIPFLLAFPLIFILKSIEVQLWTHQINLSVKSPLTFNNSFVKILVLLVFNLIYWNPRNSHAISFRICNLSKCGAFVTITNLRSDTSFTTMNLISLFDRNRWSFLRHLCFQGIRSSLEGGQRIVRNGHCVLYF